MSRILRRPMFRGGRVSSYGTGIASGLADGGMPPKRGLVTGPGGYQGIYIEPEIRTYDKIKTGKDIMLDAINRTTYYDPGALPGYTSVKKTLPIVDEGQQLGDTDYLVSKGYISDVEEPVETMSMAELLDYQIGEKGDVYQTGKSGLGKDKPEEITSIMDLDEDERIKIREKQAKAATGAVDKISTRIPKSEIDTSSVVDLDEKVLEIQNSDDAELSLEEIKEALGGGKAWQRDATDMAMLASAKLLKPGATVRSGLSEFMEAEAAKGPSRTEVIDKEAATFMLKDKFQTKRDKAKIDLMRADTDYKLAAGKKVSIQEGILASTKGSNFSDKKLGAGIQYATSDATGEKYKYKGTTNTAGLKAALNSGELKAGDTVIVKEEVEIEGQPKKTIKKVIEIQVIDGKLQVVEIYRV